MTTVQVSFDAHDPLALGRFWAQVLGYVDQPPPDGFDSWDAFLTSMGWPEGDRDSAWAIVDPAGAGPRLLFQRVPEGKTAKNRVHLDVKIDFIADGDGSDVQRRAAVRSRADELVALGATDLGEVSQHGQYWVVLEDLEGNEFCVA